LFTLARCLFAGIIAELIATKHYDSAVLFVPFLLCAAGLVAIGLS
jgi:hypothetical protein